MNIHLKHSITRYLIWKFSWNIPLHAIWYACRTSNIIYEQFNIIPAHEMNIVPSTESDPIFFLRLYYYYLFRKKKQQLLTTFNLKVIQKETLIVKKFNSRTT